MIPVGAVGFRKLITVNCAILIDSRQKVRLIMYNYMDLARKNGPMTYWKVNRRTTGHGVIIEKTGDVNGDSKVNAQDANLTRRYIVGGYGVELKPDIQHHRIRFDSRLSFKNQPETAREYNFTTKQDEVMNIRLRDGIIYIPIRKKSPHPIGCGDFTFENQ